MSFTGAVISGQGSGRKYLSLPWVQLQIKEKLSFTPFLGTLNLKLTAQSVKGKKQLAKAKSMGIFPAEGYCVGLIFRAAVGELECAIVIPKVESYPADLLEVISPLNLREQLQLKDGDSVEVNVTL